MTKGAKASETYALIWKDTPETERAELRAFADFYSSNQSFRRFFASPKTSAEEKRQVIQKGLSGHADSPAIERLLFLERQGQLDLIPEIVTHMERRKRAQVVSAEPLSDETAQSIRKQLEKLTGGSIVLEQKTDPRLIGGLTIRIGSKVYDNSIKNSLNLLKQQLGKVPCH